MARVFSVDELPRWSSTRDGRDRLDLLTDDVPVEARLLHADRIVYHPGDAAAQHYHVGCDHIFVVLEGSGVLHVDGESHRLATGESAVVRSGEVHWLVNDTKDNFSFVEFWAPPPEETMWITEDT